MQILFHEVPPISESQMEEDDGYAEGHRRHQPAFLNFSITPVECSIMCPRQLANEYFAPLVNKFVQSNSSGQSRLSISHDDFIAMQVYGEGLEAGQRVLELTSPLAMAGISIFFISTYFSDYIIVPLRSKTQVIEALEKRGFHFEMSTEAFVNNNQSQFNSCFSPISSRSASSLGSPPATPPPSSLDELQTRTFSSLRKHHIIPSVDRTLRLVQCAAHHRYSSDTSSIAILREALTTALVVDKPRLLLGSKEEILVPIMLDLRKLPLEASGIVCGVAGRLADATHARGDEDTDVSTILSHSWNGGGSSFDSAFKNVLSSSHGSGGPVRSFGTSPGYRTHRLQPDMDPYMDAVEISFLSTARAGSIIVGEHELHRAVDALEAESHEPDAAITALEL
ncbi:ACT domain-domain-containing protein [Aspergillus welwitschiae]|uniref:ACT domain-domain-containing protein n=1 Tax=Aspergillus welwitschiae TaxID=1341132 RepID=A0A3F3Q0H3_9EURO|nr:ACT domain-domain-containing protein [Aspergillus welwitschiae]RDH32734.1 ACT domain-domain-containing protein [Aspergillus welwitschiae]